MYRFECRLVDGVQDAKRELRPGITPMRRNLGFEYANENDLQNWAFVPARIQPVNVRRHIRRCALFFIIGSRGVRVHGFVEENVHGMNGLQRGLIGS